MPARRVVARRVGRVNIGGIAPMIAEPVWRPGVSVSRTDSSDGPLPASICLRVRRGGVKRQALTGSLDSFRRANRLLWLTFFLGGGFSRAVARPRGGCSAVLARLPMPGIAPGDTS
jgi:hypothetical protein